MFDIVRDRVEDLPRPAGEYRCPNGTYRVDDAGRFHGGEDQPAVFIGGDRFWFSDGELNRLTGPAVRWSDGTEYYYIKGVHMSRRDWHRVTVGGSYLLYAFRTAHPRLATLLGLNN